ncbi:SPOR domain-containing protein [Ekhidna sp. MALMAid0563]|uniref:SPOR domain-containing protein n=1 Tax=Ekhidna sp. MALMAid0563 TaxID=3143937 RepID=UPI0032DF40B4
MRTYRLIILCFLAACKATTPTSTSVYSEDLSIHRPVMMELESDSIETTQEVITEPYAPLTGHIKAELDSIAKVAYEQNKDGQYVDGFVIQVYSGNSRQDANDARYKMNEYFPELSSKVSYHQPNFRVKAGKFTNRLRAHRVYADVKEEFPRALLIPERFFLRYE